MNQEELLKNIMAKIPSHARRTYEMFTDINP